MKASVFSIAGALAIAGFAVSSVTSPHRVAAQEDPAKPAYFTEKVKPILEKNCSRCHGGASHRGGYSMNTRETLLKGGRHGVAVSAGHPEDSLMLKLINHQGPADDPMPMPPPPKPQLDASDIATIEKWIKAGAVTGDDPIFVAPPAQ